MLLLIKLSVVFVLLSPILSPCSAQAPGDGDSDCTGAENAPTYPDTVKNLMDSYNYLQLLPGNGTGNPPIQNAVWNDRSVDGNDVTDSIGSTFWQQGAGGVCRYQARVCGWQQNGVVVAQDNWLFTQHINQDFDPSIYNYPVEIKVEITYALQSCRERFGCQPRFTLHNYITNTIQLPSTSGSGFMNTQHYNSLAEVAAPNQFTHTETLPFTLEPSDTGFYIAVRDNGTCVGISRMRVYRNNCRSFQSGLVLYPDAPAPVSGSANINIKCVDNAVISGSPQVTCYSDGTWGPENPVCECRPGYENKQNKCIRIPHDRAQAPGDEDADCTGAENAPTYPNTVKNLMDSYNYLQLLPGNGTGNTPIQNAVWNDRSVDGNDATTTVNPTFWQQGAGGICRFQVRVCGWQRAGDQDNWLFTQHITQDFDPSIYNYPVEIKVELTYALQSCRQRFGCIPRFTLHNYITNTIQLPSTCGSGFMNTQHYNSFAEVAPPNQFTHTETFPFTLEPSGTGFYIAVRDNRTCVGISRMRVYRNNCQSFQSGLVLYPDAPAPVSGSANINIKCVDNAVISGSQRVTCHSDGTWGPENPVCECHPGYENKQNECIRTSHDHAQAPGDEDADCTGAENAPTYPNTVKNLMDSYNYLQLLPGNGTGNPPIQNTVWNDRSVDGNDVISTLRPTYWQQGAGGICRFQVRVCGWQRDGDQDNWLFTQHINQDFDPSIYNYPVEIKVELTYALQSCRERFGCQRRFTLHNYMTNTIQLPGTEGSGYMNTNNYQQFAEVTPSNHLMHTETLPFTLEPSGTGFYIAIRDTGTCVGISRLRVYRNNCQSFQSGLVLYPDAPAPVSGSENINIKCVDNAVISGSPRVTCHSDRTWGPENPVCECRPGYENKQNECIRIPPDRAQAPGDENADCTGAENAPTYPDSVKNLMDSYNYLQLLPGNGTGYPPIQNTVWNDRSVDGNDVISTLRPTYWQQGAGGICRFQVRVCGWRQDGAQDNWLFTQHINQDFDSSIYNYPVEIKVELTYALQNCRERFGCQPRFTLHNYMTNTIQLPSTEGSGYMNTNNYQQFAEVTPSNQLTHTETFTFTLGSSDTGFYIATRDTGTCVGISRLRVYRNNCRSFQSGLVLYPDAPAPVSGSENISIKCVDNAVISGSPGVTCHSDGTWGPENPVCECRPGYEDRMTECTLPVVGRGRQD